MKDASCLLVIEDEPKDMRNAADSARLVGFSDVEGRNSPQAARIYLEDRLASGTQLPDGILLDLDFGYDSGYELLRFWHSTPKLREIPLIVWSILGEEQRQMCELFKVKKFVGKWESSDVLRDALKSIVQSAN
jgi:CheY-like chemotaxis protein